MKNRAYRLLWITSGFAAANLALFGLMFRKPKTVSYTHLDVYKRQSMNCMMQAAPSC